MIELMEGTTKMGADFCNFCKDHPEAMKTIGIAQENVRNLEGLVNDMHNDMRMLAEKVDEAIRKRYTAGVVVIITLLSSLLSITSTALFMHLARR